MNKLIILTVITTCLVGCHHDDEVDGWSKNKLDDYTYYSYENKATTDNSPIYVMFTGYGGGYCFDIGNKVRKFLDKNNLGGTIILPRIDYKDSTYTDIEVEMIRRVLDTHDTDNIRKKILIGVSAGACLSLNLSAKWDDVTRIVPIAAGTYKDGGGTPSDNLPEPGFSVSIWFLNGYDKNTLEKYGIYWDGTVFVDPTIRLYNAIKSRGNVIMSIIPGIKHSKADNLLTDDVLMWTRK